MSIIINIPASIGGHLFPDHDGGISYLPDGMIGIPRMFLAGEICCMLLYSGIIKSPSEDAMHDYHLLRQSCDELEDTTCPHTSVIASAHEKLANMIYDELQKERWINHASKHHCATPEGEETPTYFNPFDHSDMYVCIDEYMATRPPSDDGPIHNIIQLGKGMVSTVYVAVWPVYKTANSPEISHWDYKEFKAKEDAEAHLAAKVEWI